MLSILDIACVVMAAAAIAITFWAYKQGASAPFVLGMFCTAMGGLLMFYLGATALTNL